MNNILNPRWLITINTIPTAILFFIFWNQYTVINSLLNEESIHLWKVFGGTLFLLSSINLAYAIFLIFKRKNLSVFYGIVALTIYISFLYIYGNFVEKIFPLSIPRWMVSDNMILNVGTFLMPTLMYSLVILVVCFTKADRKNKAWKNFLLAISIPISWYFFTQLIVPFWKRVPSEFEIHALLIFIIAGTLLFLFFLIRGVYIITLKKAAVWKKYQFVWKVPIAIIFPLLGLAVNNGILFNPFGIANSGVFGDFTNYWFYILAFLNGVFICLPNTENSTYRLFLFIGRSITFIFTLYFFLLFLPFLPLSVLAILAVGTGFLMLTPLVLFVIHVSQLSKDIIFLKAFFSHKLLYTFLFTSVLIIPLTITASYLKDKVVLNNALNYVYNPDYSKAYAIDTSSLSRTLTVIHQHKTNNIGGIFGTQIPYLSSYFNWLVLDNLTLSEAKINKMNQVFFGKKRIPNKPQNNSNKNVGISKISAKSRYDKSQNAWISWVDIEITNNSKSNWPVEYATAFELPTGCWISDYYLMIGEKKEKGILAEKKTAKWIFSQIRNENRDPGILYYLTGDKVAFRVFPFRKKEVRKTGIEFIHKEPVVINIDNHTIHLGNTSEQGLVTIIKSTDESVFYIPAKEKATLALVQRTPFYHFMIDTSLGKEELKETFIHRIENLLSKNIIASKNTQISFVNTYHTTISPNKDWEKEYDKQNFKGGFYVDRAIKEILLHSYKKNNRSYPVLVIVTDSLQNAIISEDYSSIKHTFPESDLFYVLNDKGILEPHSLLSTTAIKNSDTLSLKFNNKVIAFPNTEHPIAFLPDNNKASILVKKDPYIIDGRQIFEKNWQSALLMHAAWQSQTLYPEIADSEWQQMAKYSFVSKIMTPVTSYLVVENEAQKALLKKKQKQVLSGKKSLDVGKETQRMSEPSLLLIIVLLMIVYMIREKRIIKYNAKRYLL